MNADGSDGSEGLYKLYLLQVAFSILQVTDDGTACTGQKWRVVPDLRGRGLLRIVNGHGLKTIYGKYPTLKLFRWGTDDEISTAKVMAKYKDTARVVTKRVSAVQAIPCWTLLLIFT